MLRCGLERGDLGLLGFQLGQLETVIFQLLALLDDDRFRRLGDEGFVAELARLAKEVARLVGECGRIEGKLGNEGFVAKAPEAVLAKEREKLADYQLQLAKLKEQQETIKAL